MAAPTAPPVYGLEDVPSPWPKAVALGLQHVLTMFGATVAVPLLLAQAMGMDSSQTATLVSSVFIAAGLATIVQVRFGTRLPIVQGMSFAFIGPITAIAAASASAELSMQYVAGAILGGAAVEAVVGYSGLFGRLRRLISPVVIGPVIMLIGLSLYDVGAPTAGGNWLLSGTVIAVALGLALFLRGERTLKLFPVLIAVVVAYALAAVLSATGVYGPGDPGYVDTTTVEQASWFRNPADLVLPWGAPRFDVGFLVAILAGYLASMIESFGDYFAIAKMAGAPEPDERQVNRGIGAEGIGCAIAGAFGAFAATSYTENIGLVGLTRVASRRVVEIGAVALVLLGLLAKTGAAVTTIPSPVVGGVYVTLFGLIAAVGIQTTARADLHSQRNLTIIGFSLFLGLSLPVWFTDATIAGPDWFADTVSTVGSTGMAVAAVVGLLLDNLVPGTDRERGLVADDSGQPVQA